MKMLIFLALSSMQLWVVHSAVLFKSNCIKRALISLPPNLSSSLKIAEEQRETTREFISISNNRSGPIAIYLRKPPGTAASSETMSAMRSWNDLFARKLRF